MSRALTRHLTRLQPSATMTPTSIQSIDYGGGGDCLFHSFAGILARMILKGGAPARSVLEKVPSAVFMEGQAAVMQRLRMLSASVFQRMQPEDVLNHALSAVMRYKIYLDSRDPDHFPDGWDPLRLLRRCGFGDIERADAVFAFQEELSGDAKVTLPVTDVRPEGGDTRHSIVVIPNGRRGLQRLRDELTAIHSQPGNLHWGTQTDVQSLSDVLDLGILMFCDQPTDPRTCLYNIGSQREDYPQWIALWWLSPSHFRAAHVLGDVHWPAAEVPQILRDQYAIANRLSN